MAKKAFMAKASRSKTFKAQSFSSQKAFLKVKPKFG